jgi:hypothetical protein
MASARRSAGGFDHVSKYLIEGGNPFDVTMPASVCAGFVVDCEGQG